MIIVPAISLARIRRCIFRVIQSQIRMRSISRVIFYTRLIGLVVEISLAVIEVGTHNVTVKIHIENRGAICSNNSRAVASCAIKLQMILESRIYRGNTACDVRRCSGYRRVSCCCVFSDGIKCICLIGICCVIGIGCLLNPIVYLITRICIGSPCSSKTNGLRKLGTKGKA